MIRQSIFVAMLIGLGGCGGDTNNASDTSSSGSASKAKAPVSANSKLTSYLSEEKVCDVLSRESLQLLSNGNLEVEKRASSYRENFTCTYSWPRPDAAEREKNMLQAIMSSMTGDGPKLSMRDKMPDYELTIDIQKSKRLANNFVPRKLSEEEIAAQVDAAKKRAAERLTDEQKTIAGGAANSFIEGLLKKNNQNVEVTGIGDAAFWSTLGPGSLQVLDGNVQLSVAPLMADTKAEDFENAKQVATQILH